MTQQGAAVGTRKVAVITGANRGIGRAVAEGLGDRGYEFLVLCRTEEKGRRTAEALERETRSPAVSWVAADLEDPEAVRNAARTLRRRHPRVHLLVNNAGLVSREYRETPSGMEVTLAVNHLAMVLFTLGLLPSLRAAAESVGPATVPEEEEAAGAGSSSDVRIVNVSSQAHARRYDEGAFDGPGGYRGGRAYAQSKLLNLLFTFDLAPRLVDSGITVNAVHPGLILTNLLESFLPGGFLRAPLTGLLGLVAGDPSQGARTPLHVATAPELAGVTGRYFRKERGTEPAPVVRDPSVQDRARRWTEELIGEDWGSI